MCLRRRAAAFQQGVTGWEPLWVITVEGINYCLSIMRPGLGALEMANGATVAWLRYAGWLITCPVLLMFLTAMTTYRRGSTTTPDDVAGQRVEKIL